MSEKGGGDTWSKEAMYSCPRLVNLKEGRWNQEIHWWKGEGPTPTHLPFLWLSQDLWLCMCTTGYLTTLLVQRAGASRTDSCLLTHMSPLQVARGYTLLLFKYSFDDSVCFGRRRRKKITEGIKLLIIYSREENSSPSKYALKHFYFYLCFLRIRKWTQ